MNWFRVQTLLPSHPKVHALADELRLPWQHALGMLTAILAWAASRDQEDIVVTRGQAKALAAVAGYDGHGMAIDQMAAPQPRPEHFIEALIATGWLDVIEPTEPDGPETYRLHPGILGRSRQDAEPAFGECSPNTTRTFTPNTDTDTDTTYRRSILTSFGVGFTDQEAEAGECGHPPGPGRLERIAGRLACLATDQPETTPGDVARPQGPPHGAHHRGSPAPGREPLRHRPERPGVEGRPGLLPPPRHPRAGPGRQVRRPQGDEGPGHPRERRHQGAVRSGPVFQSRGQHEWGRTTTAGGRQWTS